MSILTFFVSTTAITQNTKTRGQTFWTRLNQSTIQIISVSLVNSRSLSKNQHNLSMRGRAAYDYLRKHFNFKQMLFHTNQRHFIKKNVNFTQSLKKICLPSFCHILRCSYCLWNKPRIAINYLWYFCVLRYFYIKTTLFLFCFCSHLHKLKCLSSIDLEVTHLNYSIQIYFDF